MTSSASQPYSVDWRYIKKVWREITASEYLKEKIDAIPEVVDNVNDRSTDKALSANMWRLLQDQIDELKTIDFKITEFKEFYKSDNYGTKSYFLMK